MAGSTALVSGGSAGIGTDICQRFLAQGMTVVSLDRQAPKWNQKGLEHIQCDLTDAKATGAAVAQAATAHEITHVVHNAGVLREDLVEDVRIADLMDLAQLHLGTALLMVQGALPAMRKRNFGRIVLISTRAVLGLQKRTSYSSTKAGLLALARTWSLELAPHGITVNTIAPGPIQTDMFNAAIPPDSPKIPQIANAIPVKRLGQPADIGNAVMFFASADSGFVTGQTLYVCGGTSVGSLTL
jgi:3-oxoacyl-[acyl-carrier protein] reductase